MLTEQLMAFVYFAQVSEQYYSDSLMLPLRLLPKGCHHIELSVFRSTIAVTMQCLTPALTVAT